MSSEQRAAWAPRRCELRPLVPIQSDERFGRARDPFTNPIPSASAVASWAKGITTSAPHCAPSMNVAHLDIAVARSYEKLREDDALPIRLIVKELTALGG